MFVTILKAASVALIVVAWATATAIGLTLTLMAGEVFMGGLIDASWPHIRDFPFSARNFIGFTMGLLGIFTMILAMIFLLFMDKKLCYQG